METYLYYTLVSSDTREYYPMAVSVLSALCSGRTELRSRSRTLQELRSELGDQVSSTVIEETVAWLSRSDMRLIAASEADGDVVYSIAHESLILAVRSLADRLRHDVGGNN
jgi:hypothetical protein